ncbi:MAG: hypothetical protein FWH27_03955 [Planctomycetaceae bacterium]|nr:hypothetical protein [Planctomycetaceae bacterium]
MDFDRVDKDIEQWTKNTVHILEERRKTDNDDLPIPKQTDYVNQIELIASRLEFSHICVTGSYLDKGYWRKMDESDKDVEDWFEHLGVVYDFGNLTFHLDKSHSS